MLRRYSPNEANVASIPGQSRKFGIADFCPAGEAPAPQQDMIKQILLCTGVIALAAANCVLGQRTEHSPSHGSDVASERESHVKYTCPMHPEVISDRPGKCPKCGMTLVPLKEKGKRSASDSEHAAHQAHAQHTTHNADGMAMPEHRHEMEMHSSINIADPMNREGSGTSWLPDSSPMYSRMFMFGDEMLMLHGATLPRYTNVSTRRGDDRIDAPNWIMAMFSNPLSDMTQLGMRKHRHD